MNLLAKLRPELPQDTLRLVFRTLDALAEEAGPDALNAVGESLIWLQVWHALKSPALHIDELCATIEANTRVSVVTARLAIERTNFDSEAGPETTLDHLIQLDRKLKRLDSLSAQESLDSAFQDTELLINSVGQRDGLISLCKLEEAWNPRRLDHTDLGERSKKFEFAAIDHLRSHGFMPVVRAALAFEPQAEQFYELTMFRDQTHLRELSRAICANRLRVLEVVRGIRPIRDLSAWVNYLIEGSKSLSHALGLSRKEALSFAHFCFHTVNFCDLEALLGKELNEECRRSLMDVEDALKEIASMRTVDEMVEAKALERAIDPWPIQPNLHRLADRLARLSGLWMEGSPSKGLVGMGRIELELCQPFIDALDRLESDQLAGVSEVLRGTTLMGADFTDLDPWVSVRVCVMLHEKGLVDGSFDVSEICSQIASQSGFQVLLSHPKLAARWLRVLSSGPYKTLRWQVPAEVEHLVGLMESDDLGDMAHRLLVERLSSYEVHATDSAVLPVYGDVEVAKSGVNFDDGISA